MRTVVAGLAAHLDSTTADRSYRHLITVTPRTGSVVRWTDYFQDLVVGGNTYRAGGEGTTYPKVQVGDREEVEGLEIGKLALSLDCGNVALFNGTRLTTFAALRGFDGALVLVERLYQNPAGGWFDPMHLFAGRVGRVVPGSFRVEVEIESGAALLAATELPRRVFQAGCLHMLYDAECTLSKAAFTDSETVSGSGHTTSQFTCGVTGNVRGLTTGYYKLGQVTFKADTTTVALRGVTRGVRDFVVSAGAGVITVDEPLPAVPVNGDTFDIFPGCPKTLEACGHTDQATGPAFNNLVHFRAFPFVPRNEVAL